MSYIVAKSWSRTTNDTLRRLHAACQRAAVSHCWLSGGRHSKRKRAGAVLQRPTVSVAAGWTVLFGRRARLLPSAPSASAASPVRFSRPVLETDLNLINVVGGRLPAPAARRPIQSCRLPRERPATWPWQDERRHAFGFGAYGLLAGLLGKLRSCAPSLQRRSRGWSGHSADFCVCPWEVPFLTHSYLAGSKIRPDLLAGTLRHYVSGRTFKAPVCSFRRTRHFFQGLVWIRSAER